MHLRRLATLLQDAALSAGLNVCLVAVLGLLYNATNSFAAPAACAAVASAGHWECVRSAKQGKRAKRL